MIIKKVTSNTCLTIMKTLFKNSYLLGQLIKRDVLLRYRGAYLGLLWMFLNPLVLLGIYSFVFGQIFQARWPAHTNGIPFALNLYCGLIAYNLFADAVSRAPRAVCNYPSFVRKFIFPVEILPIVPLGAAVIHAIFNSVILFGALAWTGHLNSTGLIFPVLLIPLLLLGLGLSWFLAAWGVFIKDMSQIIPVFLQMLLFLSPILYPAQAVPESFRPIYQLNPLSSVIEALRAALAGMPVDWTSWSITLVFALGILLLGYVFFQHNRDEFADAL